MQKCQQSNGLEIGLNYGDRIDEGRIAGVGPGFGFIEGRDAQDFHPRFFQGGQARL